MEGMQVDNVMVPVAMHNHGDGTACLLALLGFKGCRRWCDTGRSIADELVRHDGVDAIHLYKTTTGQRPNQ